MSLYSQDINDSQPNQTVRTKLEDSGYVYIGTNIGGDHLYQMVGLDRRITCVPGNGKQSDMLHVVTYENRSVVDAKRLAVDAFFQDEQLAASITKGVSDKMRLAARKLAALNDANRFSLYSIGLRGKETVQTLEFKDGQTYYRVRISPRGFFAFELATARDNKSLNPIWKPLHSMTAVQLVRSDCVNMNEFAAATSLDDAPISLSLRQRLVHKIVRAKALTMQLA